jgi:hypothetical protein
MQKRRVHLWLNYVVVMVRCDFEGANVLPGSDSNLTVLLIGDPQSGQFEPIVQLVRQTVGDRAVRTVADMSQLRQVVTAAGGSEPAVIVVLQAWPDQYSVADVNQLISQFPLARLVCCYGPWCDSDGRNRSIWPLAVRVPIASFAARFKRELKLLAALPLTASRTEIFEFDFDCQSTRFPTVTTALVLSPDRRWREMVGAGLVMCGANCVYDIEAARADVILFDADPWTARRASEMSTLREAHRAALLIACTGFPRPDLEEELRKSGADHVWSKLESLESLAEQIVAATEGA